MLDKLRSYLFFRIIFDTIATLASLMFVAAFSRRGLSRDLSRLNPDCAYLGNGPSLRSELQLFEHSIKECDIIVTNDFPVTPEFLQFKPRFYFIIDNAFFRTSGGQFTLERTRAICEALQSVNWDLYVFVPIKFKPVVEPCISNPKINICYFNLTPCDGFYRVNSWLYSWGLAVPFASNVLIPALILGINSNYKTIRIYGADHNWTSFFSLDEENRLCMGGQHFFSQTHSSPKVWWKSENVPILVHEALYSLSLTFKAYHAISRYAKGKNVAIYNLTKSSLIDAFQKRSALHGD